jgi:DNA-binding NarL/FixJ family response regulator
VAHDGSFLTIPEETDAQFRDRILRYFSEITPSEFRVLELLSEGIMDSEIASYRRTSVHTVRDQIKSIRSKLQVNSKTSAVLLFVLIYGHQPNLRSLMGGDL